MRQRQDYLTEAKDWLNRLEKSIAGDIALRHQDSHIELENFFRDLLNLVFDWNLENANTPLGMCQVSFDLSDKDASLAVQVTVTTAAGKIRKTLASFVGTYEKSYHRLIFVYPFMTLPASRADFSRALKGFDFDAGRDRLGFGSILKEAQGFTIDKLERLIQLLRKELRPLGGELSANHSEPSSALRTTYAKWLHETSSSFFVPGLNVSMPIEDAWVRLKVMKDDKVIVGTKSSLDEQFQNYLEFGQRLHTGSGDSTVASDSIPLTHPRSVLLGGPGDGKSTMLRRFAWRLSHEPAIVVHVRLPIVLRSMLNGRSFEEAVRLVGFDGSGITEADAVRLLNSADYLLCDGLDECDPQRTLIAERIIRWSVGHGDCRICVATRPVGHEKALLPGFTHFALQPPDDHQVQELSRRLFEKSASDDSYLLKWADFLKRIDTKSEVPHIRKLASRNPLLLGFLIRLSLDDIEIGKTRSELYGRIFDIIARTTPNDREAVDVNERIASEVADALAWKQMQTPFCSSDETLSFVSEHLRARFDLDILKADEAARSGLRFWEDRRLVETLSVGNDAKTFFIHLSLQEFAAARYARNLESSEFAAWICHARRKAAWKQVILLLAGMDDDARTASALLDLDDPRDPVSCEALLAAEAVFERDPPDLTVLPLLLESLAIRFGSDIPIVSIEAAKQLARLAPYATQETLKISQNETLNAPWRDIGSLLLRLITDDAQEMVEEFKDWFKNHRSISGTFQKTGSRDESQQIPEEARYLQYQVIEIGLGRMIKSLDVNEIAEYFDGIGERGDLSLNVVSKIQKRLTDIGLPETAKSLWPLNFDSTRIIGMESAIRRWREGEQNLLKLIVFACGVTSKATAKPPFLVLSVLISGLGYWESTGRALAELEDVDPSEDKVGAEVISALSCALKLDRSVLGAEAQAALESCTEHKSAMYNTMEQATAEPDWSVLTPDDFDAKLIAKGVLHPFSLISLAAANAIYAGFGNSEAAELIPAALETDCDHAIWHATAIAEKCLGNKAIGMFLSRLDQPIYVIHKCLFREIARHCGEEHRQAAIECVFSWLDVENPELATGIAESLAEFDPPLGIEMVEYLRKMLAHWTERVSICDKHGTVVKGSTCPECCIVRPSPRSAILKELNRLGAVSFDELIELCDDPRHDVSDWAKSIVVELATADTDTFSEVLGQVEADRLSPKILDKLLKLPIKLGGPIAKEAERLLHSSDLQLRLAIVGQLTGEWIDREVAIKYLRTCLRDEEPTIRTLATRILRLIEVT